VTTIYVDEDTASKPSFVSVDRGFEAVLAIAFSRKESQENHHILSTNEAYCINCEYTNKPLLKSVYARTATQERIKRATSIIVSPTIHQKMFSRPRNNRPRPIVVAPKEMNSTIPYPYDGPPPRKIPRRVTIGQEEASVTNYYPQNDRFQKPKKSVRFNISEKDQGCSSSTDTASDCSAATNSIDPRESPGRILTREEIKNRWYDRSELIRFREQAFRQAIIQHMKSNGDEKSLPRGMEALSSRRRKHKHNTRRYILLAYHSGKDHAYVARLCTKLGRWNNELAIRDAWVDYFEIYQPSYLPRIPPVMLQPPNIPIVPDSVSRKVIWPRSKAEQFRALHCSQKRRRTL